MYKFIECAKAAKVSEVDQIVLIMDLKGSKLKDLSN